MLKRFYSSSPTPYFIMRFIYPLLLLLLLLLPSFSIAQTNKQKAHAKMEEAIRFIEKEEFDSSQVLLREAMTLNPEEKTLYEYELASSYYMQKQYDKAIETLKELLLRKDVRPEIFQLLGNAYDMQGDQEQALRTYQNGLVVFPDAGCLYLECGNMEYAKKNYPKALPFYEKGIQKDPTYASNYYRAAKLFSLSTEVVWGMMYGEIFMNLERTSERTQEMSAILYENYVHGIRFGGTPTADFCNDIIVYSDSPYIGNRFPYHYNKSMNVAVKQERKIDFSSLHRIRSAFLHTFLSTSRNFNNILFEYHRKLMANGFFEAYNYWLLGYGNPTASAQWIKDHKIVWDAFLIWFEKNPLEINKTHFFLRSQME